MRASLGKSKLSNTAFCSSNLGFQEIELQLYIIFVSLKRLCCKRSCSSCEAVVTLIVCSWCVLELVVMCILRVWSSEGCYNCQHLVWLVKLSLRSTIEGKACLVMPTRS